MARSGSFDPGWGLGEGVGASILRRPQPQAGRMQPVLGFSFKLQAIPYNVCRSMYALNLNYPAFYPDLMT